jgi:hypothetical protein
MFLPAHCLAHRRVLQPAHGVADFPRMPFSSVPRPLAAARTFPSSSEDLTRELFKRIVECLDLTPVGERRGLALCYGV